MTITFAMLVLSLKDLARIDLNIGFYMVILPWVDPEILILSQYGHTSNQNSLFYPKTTILKMNLSYVPFGPMPPVESP